MNSSQGQYYKDGKSTIVCNYLPQSTKKRSRNIDIDNNVKIQEYWNVSLSASNATCIGYIGIPPTSSTSADFQNDIECLGSQEEVDTFNEKCMINNDIVELDDLAIGYDTSTYTSVEEILDMYQSTVIDRIETSSEPPSDTDIDEAYNTITGIIATSTNNNETSIHLLYIDNKHYDYRIIDKIKINEEDMNS